MPEYEEYVSAYCDASTAPALAAIATRFDDNAAQKAEALFEVRQDLAPSVLCSFGVTGVLAQRVTPEASAAYVMMLLGRVWALVGTMASDPEGKVYLTADTMRDLRGPYQRLIYRPPEGATTYARIWFGCAFDIGVDLREREDCQVNPDWGFGEGFIFSPTWAWAKYNGHYGETVVLDALRQKLDTVTDGNLLISMLRDLMDPLRPGTAIRALVAQYRQNTLVTDNGINGAPRPSVGAEVMILLAQP